MTTIVLDGLNEEDFRRSIENRLREGSTGAAIARLRALLAPYAQPGGILPERFLSVKAADLVLRGWDALGDAISRHDQPGRPVTALSIAFGWPGEAEPQPGAEGGLRPHVETSYFSDNAYPFSQSGREDLLEGYSFYGCTWSGDSEATDTTLSLEGIDDLHGALARLEERLLASEEPDEEAIRAGSLGACLLSALLVEAVTERVSREDLPRPLCVMAGSSGVYPYFDAPVAGIPEEARKAAAAQEDVVSIHFGAPAPRYSSLLMAGIPRAKKRAVLVLDEGKDELADRIARLRSLGHTDSEEPDIGHNANPVVAEIAFPDAMADANRDVPLLARKPARQPRDDGEMPGLHQVESLVAPVPSREQTASAEPDWPKPQDYKPQDQKSQDLGEAPLGPGFTMLEPDLQQRLQSLLSGDPPPIAGAPWLAPFAPTGQPAPQVPAGPDLVADSKVALPVEKLPATVLAPPVAEGIGRRLRALLSKWLARFGR